MARSTTVQKQVISLKSCFQPGDRDRENNGDVNIVVPAQQGKPLYTFTLPPMTPCVFIALIQGEGQALFQPRLHYYLFIILHANAVISHLQHGSLSQVTLKFLDLLQKLCRPQSGYEGYHHQQNLSSWCYTQLLEKLKDQVQITQDTPSTGT